MIGQPDIDGNDWNGNAHYAPNNATYHLYITYNLNALDENPIFHTQRVTDDPVQVGSICLNSGDCRDVGGSNRNIRTLMTYTLTEKGEYMSPLPTDVLAVVQRATTRPHQTQRRRSRGSVYYLANGPSLLEAFDEMSPLLATASNAEVHKPCPSRCLSKW